MTSIAFTNPFDAVTDDKEEASYLQVRAVLLILLRDILDERISNLPVINLEELVAQCNLNGPMPDDVSKWDNIQMLGLENND